MYYVYCEKLSDGQQECCALYETMKEAVKNISVFYAMDADRGLCGEYYYFIKDGESEGI